MPTLIKNGRAYPKALKLAALKATKSKKNRARTTAEIAADFNVHPMTLSTWKRTAGISKPQPPQLAAHQAAQAAIKVFNTPTLLRNGASTDHMGNPISPTQATHIQFRGKLYVV